MSAEVALLLALLLLAATALAPPPAAWPRPARRRAAARSPHQPRALGPYVGPYERWEAERKGATLLRDILTAGEYHQLHERGFLEVPSPSVTGRVYRIPRRRGLVEQIEGGATVAQLCVVPDRWLPDADIVLLHKFMIEADEARYLAVANLVAADPLPVRA